MYRLTLLSSFLALIRASCPPSCTCTSKKVDCKGQIGITQVPTGIPTDTEILDLSECNIRNITKENFENLTNLVTVRLQKQNSGLSFADSSVFQGLKNLARVNLNENKMSSLPGGIFANLSKLTFVSLNDNPLSTLPGDLFQNSPNVESFLLGNTQLSKEVLAEIGEGKFGKNMTSLGIEGTPIQDLKIGFFSGLPKLANLAIKNCEINYIRADVLKGTKIKDIDFEGNPIKNIDPNAFRGDNPGVEIFKCAKCQLTSNVVYGFIKNMPALLRLVLSDNQLNNIPRDAFTGSRSLTDIDLANNSITTIEENPFADLSRCNSDPGCVKLKENPLNCDCNLAWFYKWTESKNWRDLEMLKCEAPGEVAGKKFTELEESQFCCSNGTKCGTSNSAWVVSAHSFVAVVSQLVILLGIPFIFT